MQILQVESSDGWNWVKRGLAVFRLNPIIWIAIFFAYLLITLSLNLFLPLIGLILFYLLDPIFVAGFLIGCKALENGQDLELAHLFSAFKDKASKLVTIGGINLVGRIMVFGLIGLLFVNSGIDKYFTLIEKGDFSALLSSEVEMQFLIWVLTLAALMLPLYMAYWFSPALVEFDDVEPFKAALMSIQGCVRNFKAFTVFALSFLAVGLLFFVAVAIVGAVLGWLTVMTGSGTMSKIFIGSIGMILALLCWVGIQVVLTATQYASYKSIFRNPKDSDGMLAM